MNKHKWAKEIIHWANGGEIECRSIEGYEAYWGEWEEGPIDWDTTLYEFRIKEQAEGF